MVSATSLRRKHYLNNKTFKEKNFRCSIKHNKRYEPWEDTLLLLGSMPQAKIAKLLDRSLVSVSRRLWRLRVLNSEGPLPGNSKLPDKVYVNRVRSRSRDWHRRNTEKGMEWYQRYGHTLEFKLAKKEYDRKRYLRKKGFKFHPARQKEKEGEKNGGV